MSKGGPKSTGNKNTLGRAHGEIISSQDHQLQAGVQPPLCSMKPFHRIATAVTYDIQFLSIPKTSKFLCLNFSMYCIFLPSGFWLIKVLVEMKLSCVTKLTAHPGSENSFLTR